MQSLNIVPAGSKPISTLQKLRIMFPKGSTVYTVLRHVSRSGMLREIGVVAISNNGPRHPNYLVSEILELPGTANGNAVTLRGCGQDMGYKIAYDLGHVLYGDGYALKHQWL